MINYKYFYFAFKHKHVNQKFTKPFRDFANSPITQIHCNIYITTSLGFPQRFFDRYPELFDPSADVIIEYTCSDDIAYTVYIGNREVFRVSYCLLVDQEFTDMANRKATVSFKFQPCNVVIF